MRIPTVAAALILACAVPAAAQQPVRIQFQDGRVNLVAQNAPLRTILGEWARLGGATVVNGNQLAGPPVTLELTGVRERDAIAIILRDVAGYMLAPRRAGSTGASEFDRIVILATSTAPRQAAAPTGAVQRPALLRPPVPARPAGIPDPPEPDEPPVEVEPQVSIQGQPSGPQRPILPGLAPARSNVQVLADGDGDADAQPGPAAAPTSPANPFGIPVGSSATPGTIAPAPQQRQQPRSNSVQ